MQILLQILNVETPNESIDVVPDQNTAEPSLESAMFTLDISSDEITFQKIGGGGQLKENDNIAGIEAISATKFAAVEKEFVEPVLGQETQDPDVRSMTLERPSELLKLPNVESPKFAAVKTEVEVQYSAPNTMKNESTASGTALPSRIEPSRIEGEGKGELDRQYARPVAEEKTRHLAFEPQEAKDNPREPLTRRFGPGSDLPSSASTVAVERSSSGVLSKDDRHLSRATAEATSKADVQKTTPVMAPAAQQEPTLGKPQSKSPTIEMSEMKRTSELQGDDLRSKLVPPTDPKHAAVSITFKPKGMPQTETGDSVNLPAPKSEPSSGAAGIAETVVKQPVAVQAPMQSNSNPQVPAHATVVKTKASYRHSEWKSEDIEVVNLPKSKGQTTQTPVQAQSQGPVQSFAAVSNGPAEPAGYDLTQTKADLSVQASSLEGREAQKAEKTVPRPEIAARPVAQQIAHAARQSGDGSIEIKLSPEELGRVRLALTPSEANIIVHISVERPETLELIRRNIEMFAQTLKQEGFSNPEFSFEQFGGDASDRRNDQSIDTSVDDILESHSTATDHPMSTPIGTYGQLDIRL